MAYAQRDHGGALDSAIKTYGGTRSEWLDLSTGINPMPYPVHLPAGDVWTALPDANARNALINAARRFWKVPQTAGILAAPGASVLIAQMPTLWPAKSVQITGPTYNEHAASFAAQGWDVSETSGDAQVIVHPNNPDGRQWDETDLVGRYRIIDESFGDIVPDRSLVNQATRGDTVVLKSFGKFWGLAGLRLGFAIAAPDLIERLSSRIGPWAVSGPALHIGAQALGDLGWAEETRKRLTQDATRLDHLMERAGAKVQGGTPLFRLYHVPDAQRWQDRLARHKVLARCFPYNGNWLRLGLPHRDRWDQLEKALIA